MSTRNTPSVPRGPAAAGADTDAESGSEPESARASLRALKVMFDRGLIPPEEYEARRAEILTGAGRG